MERPPGACIGLGGLSIIKKRKDAYMIHEPRQINRTPEAAVLALFLCAAVSFVSASFDQIAGKGFLQGLGMLFFCAMIYILVRYKFSRVRYIVRENGRDKKTENTEKEAVTEGAPPDNVGNGALRLPPEELEFVVEKAQGKRIPCAECVLSLGTLTACISLPDKPKDRRRTIRLYKKAKTYRYLKNMVGAHQCMLLFSSRELEDVRLIIEPSEKMEDYLSAVARYNKEKKIHTEKERS